MQYHENVIIYYLHVGQIYINEIHKKEKNEWLSKNIDNEYYLIRDRALFFTLLQLCDL